MTLAAMKPFLSVVISALNEEKTVTTVLQTVLGVLDQYKINGEIVFLNNHSTDNTGALADAVAKNDKRVKVIHRYDRPNKDLGSSLREGFANAKGEYVIILDCDLSHDPNEIPHLLKYKDKADIIVGSRFVKGGKADMQFSRTVISRTYNTVANLLVGTKIKDMTTGFKLYKKKMLDELNLESNGFGLHVEIPIKACLKGYTAFEVPIYYKRSDKRSTLQYKKQFKSYSKPILKGLKARIFGN